MAWTEESQTEIDRLIATQDLSQVVSTAVTQIVKGHIGATLFSMGHNVEGMHAQTIDFGERLLCAAIDEIRKTRS